MKIYLKNSCMLFLFLFFSSLAECSSSDELRQQSIVSIPGTSHNNQQNITESTSSENPFICVYCCYFLTCSCLCQETCDQKVLPCLKKVISCCKSDEMK